ncbi:hypothetical protein PILCRDRAFT_11806 [Piloderma croceum F 1598]|uniref:Uncharacterized protein n=1 Tax=Piloderma croceum (strain F 1598) TaxID=765440 RepID=A0A0C3BK51_PILCF|nr:hypothetical protein PILCRDRAFT_11806 [Piloderma croceum F 1598]
MAHYIDYVKKCKDNPMITTSKIPQFIEYLVTCSWKKMHRRIHHWSSQGFIYYLGKVDETALRDAAPAVSPLQNDYPLSVKLMSMDCKNTIQKREGLDNEDEVSGLYNKTTCFKFHQLLVSTLLSFGKALEGYVDACGKRFKDLVDRAEEVYGCGTLLWFIGYSWTLCNHLKVLCEEERLHLPENSKQNLPKFFSFTHFTNTKDQVIVQPTNKVDEDTDEAGSSDEGGVDDCGNEGGEDEDERAAKDQVIVQPTNNVDGGVDEAGNNGEDRVDDCGNEGGEDEDEEFENIADKAVSSDLSKLFLEWICLQTALASTEKFPGTVVCDDTLRAHIQNLDNSTIAVSKPCCPVCWELLKLLRNDASTNFYVDGHHKTLSQVELLEWLPLEIVVKLTARLEKILLDQIKMMVKSHKRHMIHPSGQSGDSLSSDSKDGEDDLEETVEHDSRKIPQNKGEHESGSPTGQVTHRSEFLSGTGLYRSG